MNGRIMQIWTNIRAFVKSNRMRLVALIMILSLLGPHRQMPSSGLSWAVSSI